MMMDLGKYWMWAWRNIDRDRAEPAAESTAILVYLGVVAMIVVPLAIVKLHLHQMFIAWLSS